MQIQRPVMRQEQKLRMTPQLYQAIRIMALPLQDLKNTISEELEKNPALEVVEDNTTLSFDDVDVKVAEDSYDYFDDSSDPGYVKSQYDSQEDPKRKFIEGVLSRPETLHEHLIWQLRLQPISKIEFEIGELLINNLDENGFHLEPPEMLVVESEWTIVNKIVKLIQTFDPLGVGTKDFIESLLVQIENSIDKPAHSYEVVEHYMELLEREKYKEVARSLKISENDVKQIRNFIRTLDPFPGRNYSSNGSNFVVPDAKVKKRDREFVIDINDEEIPVLGINPFFENLMAARSRQNKELKQYIQSNVQGAKWFIKSIRQRNETLLRVIKAIVEFQREFFIRGVKSLVPLTLKDIAAEVGVHEATVSRTTNGKYIQTESGIFELKYFFTNSISGAGSIGSRHSKEGVKQVIKEIIEQEGRGSNKHLSDKKITEILAKKGIHLARRTVAKYRKELDIVSSYRR